MLKPKLERKTNGSLSYEFCRLVTRYWMEEDEWSGSPDTWSEEHEYFVRLHELGIEGCVFHPRIEARLKMEKWVEQTKQTG